MIENLLAITLLMWLYMKEDFRIVVKSPQVMRKVKTLQVVKIVKSPPMMKSSKPPQIKII